MKAVLDASALLAYLQDEPGSDAIETVTPEEAEIAGRLWQQIRQHGLSLGNRACLSLAIRLNVPVLTTDQIWTSLNLPITMHVVR
jgi:PIN domain nuclease of toxin-antitoxin system